MRFIKFSLFIVISVSFLILSCSSDSSPTDSNDSEEEIPTYSLTTNSSPSDGGSIDISPNKNSYEEGETVTVTANLSDGWEFVEWSGDISGTENPIDITVDSDLNLTANFEELLISDKYHGTWSTSFNTTNGSVESYLKISRNSLTHVLQREYASDRCFEEPTDYSLKSIESGRFIFVESDNNNEWDFEFSEPRTVDDGFETWTEMDVTSDAVYDDESYSLNEESVSFTPDC
jgi:hypothetical protein